VDLEDVLSIGELVVRIERAYAASLKGPVRRAVDALFNAWNIGLSLGAGGFTGRPSAQRQANSAGVRARRLRLPAPEQERGGPPAPAGPSASAARSHRPPDRRRLRRGAGHPRRAWRRRE